MNVATLSYLNYWSSRTVVEQMIINPSSLHGSYRIPSVVILWPHYFSNLMNRMHSAECTFQLCFAKNVRDSWVSQGRPSMVCPWKRQSSTNKNVHDFNCGERVVVRSDCKRRTLLVVPCKTQAVACTFPGTMKDWLSWELGCNENFQ